MEGNFIKPEQIYKATNNGLDIIIDLYPDAFKSVALPKRKFKIRPDEKTASASLVEREDKELGLSVYIVTDFGGDRQPRNGIACYQYENNLTWVQALQELGAKYHITGEDYKPETYSADYTGRDANPDEPEGLWLFDVRGEFNDFEIETILSKNVLKHIGWYRGDEAKNAARSRIKAAFFKYRFWPLNNYTLIKNRKAHTFASNDQYPMFMWDESTEDKSVDFKKIYQPRHPDKGRRFMYYGTKPTDFIHGLSQAEAEIKKRKAKATQDIDDWDDMSDAEKNKALKFEKLEYFILASGGSDALNIAVMATAEKANDYWVGWKNSETAKLQYWDYNKMVEVAKNVYQCQDIDETGKRVAHDHALANLDLFTIELPQALLEKRDSRGNPCKDLRDYFNHYTEYDFKQLIKDALPYRFWEKYPEYTGKGDDRVRTGWKYDFSNLQAYNFLNKNGFYQLEVEGRKNEYVYIHVDGNIIKEVTPNNVKKYIHNFLEERRMDHDLRDMLYRSTQLSENSLSNLKETQIDFTDFDSKRQFQFFLNGTWEISAEGIIEHKPGQIKRFVWDKDVIEHKVKVLTEVPFTTHRLADGTYDIEVNHTDCMFFNYLIQTSRMHWQKELETHVDTLPMHERQAYRDKHKFDIAGPGLNDEERQEQKQHLLNKIYAIGYNLHRYKDRSGAWATVGMDNKISTDGKSHGGSGKSILYNQALVRVVKNVFKIPGTNANKTQDPHIFHGLTKQHRTTIIDDADKNLSFRFFFEYINGDQVVNPKNNAPYTINFPDLAKLVWLWNFTFKDDPSENRRQLITVFSDYYHAKSESGYKEAREPKDDFGIQLFEQFSADDHNRFYNTMARCLQFYMSCPIKLEPPMDNVTKRSLLRDMGDDFYNWANEYFHEVGDSVNRLLVKQEAFEDFMFNRSKGSYTTAKFKTSVTQFCKLKGYFFCPSDLINTADDRIMHRVRIRIKSKSDGTWTTTSEKKSQELIYICTDMHKELNKQIPGESILTTDSIAPGTNGEKSGDDDKMPF